jgi:inosose dehydratase
VGHKYPSDPELLAPALALRGLRVSEPWVGTYFAANAMEEQTLQTFDRQMAFIKRMGGSVIVVAELTGSAHQQPVALLPNQARFCDEQWCRLTGGLNRIGGIAAQNGMTLVYHHHAGTGVQSRAEIDRLMASTDPELVGLLLDTGHCYYAGVDPLEVARDYATRIRHVHLKDIRQPVLEASIRLGRSFLDSIRAGVFTVPGDGVIDFKPIFGALAGGRYKGWLLVEAEQDPEQAHPLTYAIKARRYLRDVLGF